MRPSVWLPARGVRETAQSLPLWAGRWEGPTGGSSTLRGVDWSLRHCARKGHVTYAPTERELRGRVLRDLFILRILAVERAIRGVLILLLVYGVVRFRDRQSDLRTAFNEDLPLLRPLADKLHFNRDESG